MKAETTRLRYVVELTIPRDDQINEPQPMTAEDAFPTTRAIQLGDDIRMAIANNLDGPSFSVSVSGPAVDHQTLEVCSQ